MIVCHKKKSIFVAKLQFMSACTIRQVGGGDLRKLNGIINCIK